MTYFSCPWNFLVTDLRSLPVPTCSRSVQWTLAPPISSTNTPRIERVSKNWNYSEITSIIYISPMHVRELINTYLRILRVHCSQSELSLEWAVQQSKKDCSAEQRGSQYPSPLLLNYSLIGSIKQCQYGVLFLILLAEYKQGRSNVNQCQLIEIWAKLTLTLMDINWLWTSTVQILNTQDANQPKL